MSDFFASRKDRLFQLKARRDKGKLKSAGSESKPCPECGKQLTNEQKIEAAMTCPHCKHHFHIGAYHRLSILIDAGSFSELNPLTVGKNPLDFPGYDKKLSELRQRTGLAEAVVCAKGKIDGYSAVFVVLDSAFLMGSMGAAMGEKVTRAVETATKDKLPLIIFTASGGARMQEGIISLMQMAKTTAALKLFSDKGGFYTVCLTHPTTGGVTASFASVADITLAEPNALIGFAGPRVIEQTIGQALPKGFQRSEFLQEHGFVDGIVHRADMKQTLKNLLMLHAKRRK